MSVVRTLLAQCLDALEADPDLAARVRTVLLVTPKLERIDLAAVTEHGAPSVAWVQARAREGKIEIRGPRGRRYVQADDLAALIAETTIARRSPKSAPQTPRDASGVVADLAARRAKKTA